MTDRYASPQETLSWELYNGSLPINLSEAQVFYRVKGWTDTDGKFQQEGEAQVKDAFSGLVEIPNLSAGFYRVVFEIHLSDGIRLTLPGRGPTEVEVIE